METVKEKRWCIYRTTNIVNGKTYIGQHLYYSDSEADPLGTYYGSGSAFIRALQKYTKQAFTREILVSGLLSQEDANNQERLFISSERAAGRAEYNIESGGAGYIEHSRSSAEEVRSKISASLTGKIQSEETKKRRSESLKNFYSTQDQESKTARTQKAREATLGTKRSPEYRQKISETLRRRYAAGEIKTTKGQKYPGRRSSTTFKPGNIPWNTGKPHPRKPGVTEKIQATKRANPEKQKIALEKQKASLSVIQQKRKNIYLELKNSGRLLGTWNQFQQAWKQGKIPQDILATDVFLDFSTQIAKTCSAFTL